MQMTDTKTGLLLKLLRTKFLVLSAAISLTIGFAGQAFAQTPASTYGAKVSPREMLPAKIRAQGYITSAVDPSFGPIGLFTSKEDPNTLIGFDIDVIKAATAVLGIEVKHEVTAFIGIIPGLQSGRWDIGGNSYIDTVERRAVVDMLDIRQSYSVIMVNKENPLKIASVSDLCGKNIGQTAGAAQLIYLQDYSEAHCRTPMKFLVLKTRADVFLAMEAGRVDAHVISTVSAAGNLNVKYNPENAAKFDQVSPPGERLLPTYEAWAIPKNDPQLRDALAAALQEMIDNGTYAKISEKWGMPETEIKKALINGVER